MLAGSAPSLEAALDKTGPALVEAKADGARIQIHREGPEVRVFTRALNDVTPAVPEIVEVARSLPSDRFVIDGEAVAWSARGPLPFQETSKRIGADRASARARRTRPLRAFLFDCLLEGGAELVDSPLRERKRVLADLVADPHRLPAWELEPDTDVDGADLLEQVVDAGWEGLMVKSLEAPYRAGRRGSAWLKVKRAWALDLVVLAAEWGSGRRRGKLSNLHLGARDAEHGGFVMLGKTFKGLTDEMLAWQTDALRAIATHEEAHVVWVRPELVVEIAFDGIQKSSRYPAGMALRFARVKSYRPDKPAAEADTIDTVRRIFRESRPPEPPPEQTDLFGSGS
jgi:DNA ligase-1